MTSTACEHCGHDVPAKDAACPHCGQPSRFPPNVRAARLDAERTGLDHRYREAFGRAETRGCRAVVEAFEAATGESRAVIGRPLREADRLAVSDRELYSSYYQRIDAEHQSPSLDDWDHRRRVADEAIFPGYKEAIRFAALTLDGEGVASYGGQEPEGFCFLVLRSQMIAHRASVFEDNSTLVFERHGRPLPPGFRAPWEDRAKLCVAKLADDLLPESQPEQFPGILVRPADSNAGERFVEVHVFGPMSIRTVERVLLKPQSRKLRKAMVHELARRLARFDVELETR